MAKVKFFLIPLFLFLSACTSLFYYPTQNEYYKIKDLPYKVEDLRFSDSMGNQIHAWYFHSPEPKGKILFFHGNAQNLTAHFAMLSWLVDFNYDLMIFDYPGYGQSTGIATPESTTISGVAALDRINQIKPDLPLFVYGQSLGGQILQKSLNLYPKKNYKAVFIEASFLSYRRMARSAVSKNWITWILQPIAWLIMSDEYAGDPEKIAPIPLYVMHGDQDQVVSSDQGRMIFDKAKEPKAWKSFAGGQHSDTYFINGGIHRKFLLEALETERLKMKD